MVRSMPSRSLPVWGQTEQRRERADALANRARILEAARRLMKRRPLDELCMDELAAAAGLGKGTLYRRFADKQALLHALLDDSERALQDEVKQSFSGGDLSAGAAALALLDRLYSFAVDHAAVLAAAEASARGEARFTCAPYRWRHAVVTHHLQRAGVADGDAADQLADMLLSAMSGEVVSRALGQQSAEAARAQAHSFFAAVVLRGPQARQPARPAVSATPAEQESAEEESLS